MIIGISSVLDEIDILPSTVNHLLGEGVDKLIVSDGGSTDGTREWLQRQPRVSLSLQEGIFDQGVELTRLAYLAAESGATWIVPFDADEFWIDPLGTDIATVLDNLPADCLKVHTAVFKHADWDHKYTAQNPLGKCAFRPADIMTVHWGNHDTTLSREGTEEHGLLEIRELQYRDYDHFLHKVEKARRLFASWDVPIEHGHHMRVLADTPDGALPAEYLHLRDGETIFDPIPIKGTQ